MTDRWFEKTARLPRRITREGLAEMRRLDAEGLFYKEIAERMGIHKSTVSRWLKRSDEEIAYAFRT